MSESHRKRWKYPPRLIGSLGEYAAIHFLRMNGYEVERFDSRSINRWYKTILNDEECKSYYRFHFASTLPLRSIDIILI